MEIKPKFFQFNCNEGDKIDLRQAEAVLEHKPDVIIFEMPQGSNRGSGTVFNRYPGDRKPIEIVFKIISRLRNSAKIYPYAMSDVSVWENIMKMWKSGINTQIYNVDTPDRLRKEYSMYKDSWFKDSKYPAVRTEWFFWVYLYLRDSHMAQNIKHILKVYSKKSNPVVLVFLQSLHWKNVQFLLSNPSKNEIWDYYFGNFENISKKNITAKVKEKNKVLHRYWLRNSDFV